MQTLTIEYDLNVGNTSTHLTDVIDIDGTTRPSSLERRLGITWSSVKQANCSVTDLIINRIVEGE